MNRFRRAIPLLKFLIPAAILPWLLFQLDAKQLEVLRDQPKDWWLLATGASITLFGFGVSYSRWMLLVRRIGIPVTLTEAVRLGFMGQLFSMVSPGSVGGDLFKAIAVARHKKHSAPGAIASVLVDRAVGLFGLIVLMTVSLYLFAGTGISPTLAWIRRLGVILTLVGSGGLAVAIIGGKWLDWIERILKKIPRIGHQLQRVVQSLRMFEHRPDLVLAVVGLSLVVHTLLSLSVFLISRGLYPDSPTLVQHLQVVPPGMAAGALPIAPAGLGVQEYAFVVLFKQLPDLSSSFSGLAVAAAYRFVTILIAGIGVIYYWASRGQQLVHPTEGVSASSNAGEPT